MEEEKRRQKIASLQQTPMPSGTETEGQGQDNAEDACLFNDSADLDKTYESCSPYCEKPCQIHFNLDETGSDDNDDITGNK